MSGICAKPRLAYKGRMERHADAFWLIWSNKWGSWYRSESCGYTRDIAQAGIYTKTEAATHFDGTETPRNCRDTEPFPISAIRRHIDQCEREAGHQYKERKAGFAALRYSMDAVQ